MKYKIAILLGVLFLAFLVALNDCGDSESASDRIATYEEAVRINPNSPEAAILSGDLDHYPSPTIFLGLEPTEVSETAVSTQFVHDERKMTIQTGSYSMRENAEYALQDLKAAGFSPEIREKVVGDKRYFRVILPDIAYDSVDEKIDELNERGFEGISVEE